MGVTVLSERFIDLRRDLASGGSPVMLAAGDLVCGTGTSLSAPCQHAAVAAFVAGVAPDAVLLPCDIKYDNGTLADFYISFDASWATDRAWIKPALGNHEYNTSGATGYYDYFNGDGVQSGAAGYRSKGCNYSYNLGSWHVIAILNINCAAIGGCGSTSAQVAWLVADLVLAGHDHDYERFAPQTATATY